MDNADVHSAELCAIDELQQASGVASGDGGRARGTDMLDFALQQSAGHLGLNDVVDTGAPTAPGTLGKFDQF